jgi:hypothetical protein
MARRALGRGLVGEAGALAENAVLWGRGCCLAEAPEKPAYSNEQVDRATEVTEITEGEPLSSVCSVRSVAHPDWDVL